MPSNDIAGLPARRVYVNLRSRIGPTEHFGRIFDAVCGQLLRAHTAECSWSQGLGRSRVVLTLSGGRVFRNPITLIWEAIQWATDQVKPLRLHVQSATGS